jgi:hypothetical protein
MTPAPSRGRTEILNGVQLYFEVHGTGEPLPLLSGFFRVEPGLEGIPPGMERQFSIYPS